MATVFFDDQEVAFQLDQGDTLLDLLLVAQEKLWGPDREIHSIKVNDLEISPLSEDHLKTIQVEGANVYLELSDPRKDPNLKDTIVQGIAYLKHIHQEFEGLSERIRRGDPAEKANEDMKMVMEGMVAILDLLQAIHMDERCADHLREKMDSTISEFIEIVRETNEALESDDPSLLGDLIEFEFPEIVEQICDVLQIFLETL